MSTLRQRSSPGTSTSSKRNGKAAAVPSQKPAPLPAADDRKGWHAHWQAQGQPWRTEPEIEQKRQAELDRCRTIVPDIENGIYPFKKLKLDRADIEWLLATHENGLGPIDWSDLNQRTRQGLDLRGTNLHQVDLHGLPLAGLCCGLTEDEWLRANEAQRTQAITHMDRVRLDKALLQGANLVEADLQNASLVRTSLEKAEIYKAQLEKANLHSARLVKAGLIEAHLQEANLRQADLRGADLREARLENVLLKRLV
jgi:uncharacterized protein YjbI with pentapeptide repeats